VYVSETFTMTGGDISGNTAKNGGGVYVGGYYQGNGTFTMSGGTIGGNSAGESGGGVYTRGMFTKSDTGGIVYGSNAPVGQANKAPSDAAGHAVYVAGERPQKRTTTAGESTALDSRKSLVAGGGWE
jgi:hypothetical protein